MGARETQFQPPSTVTDRFYVALKAIYGTKFSAQFQTPAEVHQSKAMWGREIDGLSEGQLRACLKNAKRELMTGNPNYLWPNIGLILGHSNSSWEHDRLKYVQPVGIEDKTAKEKRRLVGIDEIRKLREQCGL